MIANTLQCLLFSRYCSEQFTQINSLNPHKNLRGQKLILAGRGYGRRAKNLTLLCIKVICSRSQNQKDGNQVHIVCSKVFTQLPHHNATVSIDYRKESRSVMSESLRLHGCSLPGSSIHGIFQARVLEWVAITTNIFKFVRECQNVFQRGYTPISRIREFPLLPIFDSSDVSTSLF